MFGLGFLTDARLFQMHIVQLQRKVATRRARQVGLHAPLNRLFQEVRQRLWWGKLQGVVQFRSLQAPGAF